MTADAIIRRFDLQPHPEGGHFRETYRAAGTIARSALPDGFGGDRSFATSILFLLQGDEFSALHRIAADEGWHYYLGTSPLEVVELSPTGELGVTAMGIDLDAGEVPQHVVPAGHWFGARLATPEPGRYALVGCTVAPGFDFADFEMARRDDLASRFPAHAATLAAMTR